MSNESQRTLLPRFLLAGFLTVALLQFAALLLPWERMWGVDMLRYLGPAANTGYALIIVIMAGLLEYLRRKERVPDEKLLIILALVFAALLAVFPIDTFFYGDGGLLIPQIHRYSVNGSFDNAILLNVKSSPLTGALLVLYMKAVPALLPWKPATALYPFIWLSVTALLFAVIYIIFSYKGLKRAVALLALMGSAGGLLFRGYPEFYAPVFAAIAVYLVAGERAARHEAPLWHPVTAFIIAVAAHYMALALLPSLAFLVLSRSRIGSFREWSLRRALVACGVLYGMGALFYFVLNLADSTSRIVMPIAVQSSQAGQQTYTLFSIAHLLDFANLLLLLAPLALLMLLLLWSRQLRTSDTPDATSAFHALTVVLFLGFTFFVNASLGLARDWDLVSPLGVILLFAAVAAMEHARIKYGALALVVVSAVLLTPWHELHRDGDATAERFASIMRLDDEHMYGDYALSGYDALRKYAHRQEDPLWEMTLTQRMISLVGYPQHYRELIGMAQQHRAAEPQQTLQLQRWMLTQLETKLRALSMNHPPALYAISMRNVDSLTQAIGFLAHGNGQFDQVVVDIARIASTTRHGASFPAITALDWYQQRQYDSAIVYFEASLTEDFATPGLYLLFGNALALTQRYSESLSRFEEGVRRFPDEGILRFTLGKYYLRAGIQVERAAELMQWCITNENPADKVEEAQRLLTSLVR